MHQASSVVRQLRASVIMLGVFGMTGCTMEPSVREIAGPLTIGTEWLEIRPDPPLEVQDQVQRISVDVPDVAQWDLRVEEAAFVMPDGTPVRVEVELVAADGERFVLDSVGLGPGLTFSRLPAPQAETRLPPDATFVAVRLRSDRPIEAAGVSWFTITNY